MYFEPVSNSKKYRGSHLETPNFIFHADRIFLQMGIDGAGSSAL